MGKYATFFARLYEINDAFLTVGKLVEKQGIVAFEGKGECDKIVGVLSKNSVTLTKILLTHGHFDHTGAVAELIMEVIFSPFGYKIVSSWKRNSVGKEYLDYMAERGKIT